MRSIKTILATLSLLLFAVSPVLAQKIGYVHSQKVLSEYQEYIDVQKKLAGIQQQYEQEYNRLAAAYEQLLKDIETQTLLLSPEKKAQKQKEVQNKALEIEKYKYEKLGPQGEFYKKQAELGQPVLDKVNAVIKSIGEAEGYDYILDGATGSILFAKPEHDISQLVLDELNKKTTKK